MMSGPLILISTVRDGSMLNRDDFSDPVVIANREAFLKKNAVSLNQTTRLNVMYDRDDYKRYLEVHSDLKGAGMRGDDVEIADALVTTDKQHALFLPIADCVGAVIFDPATQVLMLSHLGRHSMVQYGAEASVRYLVEHYDSRPEDLKIWLSPAASKDNYPLWDLDNAGLIEAAFEQLQKAGVRKENIKDFAIETDKSEEYFSHSEFEKGHRVSDGRFAIVAMMT